MTRWHLKSKAWRRLGAGVYASSRLPDTPQLRLRAVLVRHPTAAFSGLTSTWLHGLDVLPCNPIAHVDAGALGAHEVVERQGLRTTSLVRTLLDLSRELPAMDAVPLIDMAAREGLVSMDALQRAVARSGGARNVTRMRHALELVDPAAESPMESRLRIILIEAGLPRPQLQVQLFDSAGRPIGRADLYYPSRRLVIEYDGGTHRDSLVKDNRRQNAILAAGYKLLRFTAPDVLKTPQATVRQVRAILSEPATPSSLIPRAG